MISLKGGKGSRPGLPCSVTVSAKRQKNDAQAGDRPKQVLGLDSAGPTHVLIILKGESCLEEQGELGEVTW